MVESLVVLAGPDQDPDEVPQPIGPQERVLADRTQFHRSPTVLDCVLTTPQSGVGELERAVQTGIVGVMLQLLLE